MTENPSAPAPRLTEQQFRRRFRSLVLLAWTLPPVLGLSFLLYIRMFTPGQMLDILMTPLEPAFIFGSLGLALWLLDRRARPIARYLAAPDEASAGLALTWVRRFPPVFWGIFLAYLLAAPASVILSAEMYAGFQAQPVDWFRIHLVALIVSIIVGLPIFFRIFDLFGEALSGAVLTRPVLSIRTRVFLIGSLVPLLIDTMLVQYYWTRTGYFTAETFGMWLALEVLAVAGSLLFVRSFDQSLAPLQQVIRHGRTAGAMASLRAQSTDELGVLAGDFRRLVEQLSESEQNLRSIGENANDGIVVHINGRIVFANRRMADMLGYQLEELHGADLANLLPPEEYALVRSRFEARLRGEEVPQQYETRVLTRQGSPHPVEISVALGTWQGKAAVVVLVRDIAERKEAERALRQSEMLFSRAFHASPALYSISRMSGDLDGDTFIAINDAFLRATGYTRAEVLGSSSLALGLWVDANDRAELVRRLRAQGSIAEQILPFRTKTGEVRHLLGAVELIHIDGEPCALIVGQDITERRRAEAALFREKERAQVTLASIAEGVITTDIQGVIEYLNPVAEQLTGWPQAGASGRGLAEVLRLADEGNRRSLEEVALSSVHSGDGAAFPRSALLLRRDGREFPVEISAAPIRDRRGELEGAVIVFRDVSQERTVALQMAYQATHDPLTGLLNRREFERRLARAVTGAREHGEEHALCYFDLDQFKLVNDTCGHVAGDELLRQLAERLQERVRASDTLARLGGDEFGVLLENCPVTDATLIADNLRRAISEFRFVWKGRPFEVGASIGLVPLMQTSGSLSEVLSAADSACYVAKDRGRNRIHVYQPDDALLAQRQGDMQWVSRITHAFEEGRFELHIQPIKPLVAGAEDGLFGEVLIRMWDERGELVSPYVFLRAAERYGLMPSIDRWVVRAALKILSARVAREGGASERFSINLSGQSLGDPHFLDFVTEELGRHSQASKRLCFEITETAAIANLAAARRFMEVLHDKGVRFALDDFGSGLSSFAYLRDLKVDYLKIAGEFVRNIASDATDRALVESINQVGHVMGMLTIAESVENEAALDLLRVIGVDYVQGFGVAVPSRFE